MVPLLVSGTQPFSSWVTGVAQRTQGATQPTPQYTYTVVGSIHVAGNPAAGMEGLGRELALSLGDTLGVEDLVEDLDTDPDRLFVASTTPPLGDRARLGVAEAVGVPGLATAHATSRVQVQRGGNRQ